ncbi:MULTISPECIES: nicotinate-nucleotide--dimethylbenzimidazole phosphoribosyltransferase [Thermocrispum]|uniref:nicotinate-nucleotide--dimethylbenzimidazole phosphoribosyltransferase n=1 Tax=Thermocrispum TaxID=37924 RepID=UPI0004046A2A|nr:MULTISPECIES: nicotinate-nucleotide--dimethylbenzimidazole phosphoribosyltransferase [Thermocrispum]
MIVPGIPTIPAPDQDAERRARDVLDSLVKPKGSLGRLEELAAWLSGRHGSVPPGPVDPVHVVVFAGDHGVSHNGVSAYPRDVTAAMVRVFHSGKGGVNVLARQVGAQVRVVDIGVDADLTDMPPEILAHKVCRGSGSIDTTDALSPEQTARAFREGQAVARAEIAAGARLLIPGDMGIGNTTIASALVAAHLGLPAEEVVGGGTGIDPATRAHKTAVVKAALDRAEARITDPFSLLTVLGSACAAATAGFVVEAAARRTPVVLDGVFTTAAALVAAEIAPGAAAWWLSGHRSTEPAQEFALKALGLQPIVDLGMRLGEGSGAVQAIPFLRAARAVISDMGLLSEVVPPDGGTPR